MNITSAVMCPNLKGSTEGNICGAANALIRNMKDVAIQLCMNRHHEACSVYKKSLLNMIEFGSFSVNLQNLELDHG